MPGSDKRLQALSRLLVDLEWEAGIKDQTPVEVATTAVGKKFGDKIADSYRHARKVLGDK